MDKKVYSFRKYGKQLVAVAIAAVTFANVQSASADSWTVNTPDQIQIEPGQMSYTLKKGDTLWALSQKINLKIDFLAKINNIDLSKGEEKRLPVGRVVSWHTDEQGQEFVDVEGRVFPVLAEDKTLPNQPVGSVVLASNDESKTEILRVKVKNDSEVQKESLENEDLDSLSDEGNVLIEEGFSETKTEEVQETDGSPTSSDKIISEDLPEQPVVESTKIQRLYAYLRETKNDAFTNVNSTQLVIFKAEGYERPQLFKETSMIGRDPSIIKEGDDYYIAVTHHDRHNGRDFMVYKTRDFETFESIEVKAGIINESVPHVWAPDFYRLKDGRVGVIVSANDRGEEVDVLGHTILSHSPYTMTLDLATGIATDVKRLELNDGNKIDGHIFLKDDVYHLIIKDETRKELELWTSESMTDWTKVYDVIPNTGQGIEGAFVEQVDEAYRITYDRHYAFNEGDPLYINYVETDDFVNFSQETAADLGEDLRHGSVVVEELPLEQDMTTEELPSVSQTTETQPILQEVPVLEETTNEKNGELINDENN